MATRVILTDRTKEILKEWYDESLLATPIFVGTRIGAFFGLLGQRATTINGVVHLTSNAQHPHTDERIALIGHELFHVEEQKRIGWGRYLWNYLRLWRPIHLAKGHLHPMESGAYDREIVILEHLYD